MLGHKFICLGLAMLYYPFMYVAILALMQTLAFLAYLLLKMCGVRLRIVPFAQGTAYVLNLAILQLCLYGLTTRVPQNNSPYCFDL
jgi:hypothetical protein